MRLRARLSRLEAATTKLTAVNRYQQEFDAVKALTDDELRAIIGDHWSQHCTTLELLAMARGELNDQAMLRLKWKYRNGPVDEARRRTG